MRRDSVESLPKNRCAGCGACARLCPQKCIEMRPDAEGFLAPVVDANACSGCGLCLDRCPQNADVARAVPLECFAAKHKSVDVLKKSSSGGVFTLLADEILRRGGSVFGCVFEKNASGRLEARHAKAVDERGLEKMRGSKYVQSAIGTVYDEAKEELEKGRWVLFTGTPCQIAGLKAFLRKDYETLITCDLICHGTPSPLLFDKYLEYLEQKKGGEILSYEFRDKTKGWGLYYYAYSYKNKRTGKIKTEKGARDKDGYFTSFSLANAYRECCYQCRYANSERVADVTIGDYFSVDFQRPEFSSSNGVSSVLVNSSNGKRFLEAAQKDAEWLPIRLEEITRLGGNVRRPTKRPQSRDFAYAHINADADVVFSQSPHRVTLKGKIAAFVKERLSQKMRKRLRILYYKKIEKRERAKASGGGR